MTKRLVALPISILALPLLLNCSSESEAPASSTTTNSQIEGLQQRLSPGRWVGTTSSGDACGAYIAFRSGNGVEEFEVRVSLDKENIVNGVVLPLDDGRMADSFFYLNSAGATNTTSFAVSDSTVDVESDDHSVKEGRTSRLLAKTSASGFEYIEVSEARGGAAAEVRRCENVAKK